MSRRSQGLGRIMRRVAKDGTISWRLGWELPPAAEIDPNTGKPKRQYGYKTIKGGTKKDAQIALEKIKASLREGSYVVPARATFGQCCEEWLQSLLDRSKVRPNTWAGYANNLRTYVIPRVGSVEIQRATTAQIQNLYDTLLREGASQRKQTQEEDSAAAGLSPRTVISIHRNVKQVIQMAMKQKRLAVDPLMDVELPKASGDSDAQDDEAGGVIHALDEKQLDALLQGFAGHQYETFVRMAAATGARRGELMGLRWCDVDNANSLVRIEWVVVDGGRKADRPLTFARPKTKRSRRAIDLDPGTLAALDAYWKR